MVETGSRDHSAHLWLVRRPVPPPAGAMTLKQLNDRLEAYINGIGLSPEGPNVSIAVDRISEGGSFNIHDMPQWAEYQQMVSATSNTNIFFSYLDFRYFFIQLKIFFQCKAYEDQEEELARVEAEIAILTHDNQDYQERLRNMQIRIEEKKREISDLEIKIRDYEYKKKVRRIWNFIVLILIH